MPTDLIAQRLLGFDPGGTPAMGGGAEAPTPDTGQPQDPLSQMMLDALNPDIDPGPVAPRPFVVPQDVEIDPATQMDMQNLEASTGWKFTDLFNPIRGIGSGLVYGLSDFVRATDFIYKSTLGLPFYIDGTDYDDSVLSHVAGSIDKVADAIRPDNAGWATTIPEMISRSATYFIPGLGIVKMANAPRLVGTMAGRLLTGLSGAGIEAAANAGATAEHASKHKQGMNPMWVGTKVFFADLAINSVLNTVGPVGLGSSSARKLSRYSLAAATEGTEEAAQQAVEMWALEERIDPKAVGTAFAGGAFLGPVLRYGFDKFLPMAAKMDQDQATAAETDTAPSTASRAARNPVDEDIVAALNKSVAEAQAAIKDTEAAEASDAAVDNQTDPAAPDPGVVSEEQKAEHDDAIEAGKVKSKHRKKAEAMDATPVVEMPAAVDYVEEAKNIRTDVSSAMQQYDQAMRDIRDFTIERDAAIKTGNQAEANRLSGEIEILDREIARLKPVVVLQKSSRGSSGAMLARENVRDILGGYSDMTEIQQSTNTFLTSAEAQSAMADLTKHGHVSRIIPAVGENEGFYIDLFVPQGTKMYSINNPHKPFTNKGNAGGARKAYRKKGIETSEPVKVKDGWALEFVSMTEKGRAQFFTDRKYDPNPAEGGILHPEEGEYDYYADARKHQQGFDKAGKKSKITTEGGKHVLRVVETGPTMTKVVAAAPARNKQSAEAKKAADEKNIERLATKGEVPAEAPKKPIKPSVSPNVEVVRRQRRRVVEAPVVEDTLVTDEELMMRDLLSLQGADPQTQFVFEEFDPNPMTNTETQATLESSGEAQADQFRDNLINKGFVNVVKEYNDAGMIEVSGRADPNTVLQGGKPVKIEWAYDTRAEAMEQADYIANRTNDDMGVKMRLDKASGKHVVSYEIAPNKPLETPDTRGQILKNSSAFQQVVKAMQQSDKRFRDANTSKDMDLLKEKIAEDTGLDPDFVKSIWTDAESVVFGIAKCS